MDALVDRLTDGSFKTDAQKQTLLAWLSVVLDEHSESDGIESGLHAKQPDRVSSWAAAAAEFAYRRCGVEQAIRVAAELSDAADFEALLYQSKPGYRDHLFHVLRVCAMGYRLQTALRRNCFNHDPLPLKSVELANWCVATLFHDRGYLLETYRGISERAAAFDSDHVQRFLGQIKKSLVKSSKDMNREAQSYSLQAPLGSRLDHGVVSFLHLRRILRRIDQGRDPTRPYDSPGPLESKYRPALVAILKHNLMTEPISVRDEPLAALLIVCDELQEWGRWKLARLGPALLDLIDCRRIIGLERRYLTQRVTFDSRTVEWIPSCFDGNGNWQDGRLQTVGDQAQVWIRVEYANQNHQDSPFDPLTLLLAKLMNFERLRNTSDLRLGLELRFELLKDGSTHARELEILADFVLQQDAGYISHAVFTPNDQQAKFLQPVTYVAEREHDVVYVNLSLMDQQAEDPLLSRPPWDFRRELLRFKRDWVRDRGIRCLFLDKDD